MPIVPFENRATILGGGASELEDCIPLLRRIDKFTLDLLMTSDVAAFRQKWATGLDVPKDPDTGKPVEPYKAAVDRLWVNPSADGSIRHVRGVRPRAIPARDRGVRRRRSAPYRACRRTTSCNRTSRTRRPPSRSCRSESGLVAKVRERQRRFGEARERATALSLAGTGDEQPTLEVVWQDAEMRNPAQVADAATKLQTIGVPQRALWEYVGATPQQMAEWTLEAAGAELVALAAAPTAPSSNGSTAGPPA